MNKRIGGVIKKIRSEKGNSLRKLAEHAGRIKCKYIIHWKREK